MDSYGIEFSFGKFPGFIDDILGNTYLTDIMKQTGMIYCPLIFFRFSHPLRNLKRILRNSLGMTAGITILGVYCGRKRSDDTEVHLPQFIHTLLFTIFSLCDPPDRYCAEHHEYGIYGN